MMDLFMGALALAALAFMTWRTAVIVQSFGLFMKDKRRDD